MLESNAENVSNDLKERQKIDSTKDIHFFSPIKNNKYLSLDNANITTTLRKNAKQREVTCQRDVLGLLVSTSYTTKKPVDIDKAVSLPLSPVSLLLCTSDGAMCKTVKNKLHDASISELAIVPEPPLPKSDLLQTYFVDLVAFIRTISLDSTNRSMLFFGLASYEVDFSSIYGYIFSF